MKNQQNSHPITLANNYAHFTMAANYWYAKNPTNSTGIFYQRGLFYDRLACDCLNALNAEQQKVAHDFYRIKRESKNMGSYLSDSFQVVLNVA